MIQQKYSSRNSFLQDDRIEFVLQLYLQSKITIAHTLCYTLQKKNFSHSNYQASKLVLSGGSIAHKAYT